VYNIFLLPQAQKDLDDFKGKIFQQIRDKIILLRENPHPSGCLKLTAEEGYCLRSGNYRMIYRISDKERKVYIYRIRNRKDAY
jgi:mRNA interferase RelE/StbE